jgi:hypothetical protein
MLRRPHGLWILGVSIPLLWTPFVRAELECAQPVVEKGEVRSGMSLSHRFPFVNRGPDAVEVTEVRPSCGCLVPKLEQRRFEAGESGVLLLEVNTLTQPAGANSWRATIHYKTGGVERELPLYICARVVTEISVEPPSLAIYTDTSISHEILVIDRRTEPLIVRAMPASSPYVRTHLGELHRNEAGHWVRAIQVEVLANCPEGTHEETLRICTSDPLYAELKVPFTIVKRARQQVSAAPHSVVLSETGGQPLPARIVLLSAADDREVRIERVESDNAAIDCHWAQGPGHRATLKIRVDRARITGDSLRSAVHVHLSGPTPQTMTIPVSCSLH